MSGFRAAPVNPAPCSFSFSDLPIMPCRYTLRPLTRDLRGGLIHKGAFSLQFLIAICLENDRFVVADLRGNPPTPSITPCSGAVVTRETEKLSHFFSYSDNYARNHMCPTLGRWRLDSQSMQSIECLFCSEHKARDLSLLWIICSASGRQVNRIAVPARLIQRRATCVKAPISNKLKFASRCVTVASSCILLAVPYVGQR